MDCKGRTCVRTFVCVLASCLLRYLKLRLLNFINIFETNRAYSEFHVLKFNGDWNVMEILKLRFSLSFVECVL